MSEKQSYELDGFYINIYSIIKFLLILISYYFINVNRILYLEPFILFIIFFIMDFIEVNIQCNLDKQPISELFNKTIILLSGFLFFQHTIKCIPIFSFFKFIFDYPLLGIILKLSICYFFTIFINYMINYYLKSDNDDDSDPNCRIQNMSDNMTIELLLFIFIIINTYIQYFLS